MFPCCHSSCQGFASCHGMYQSQRASHAGIESGFVPGKKNVAQLQIKTQGTLSCCISQGWSILHNQIGKANYAHKKPKPSCNTAKNTKYLPSAKKAHVLSSLLLSFAWSACFSEGANESQAEGSIRGWVVFLCRAKMWGMLRMTVLCECCALMWSSAHYIKTLTNPHLRHGYILWEEGRTAKWESWAQSWRIGPTQATHCGYVVGDDVGDGTMTQAGGPWIIFSRDKTRIDRQLSFYSKMAYRQAYHHGAPPKELEPS